MLFPEAIQSNRHWRDYLHDEYSSCLQSVVWPRKIKLVTEHLRLQKLVIVLFHPLCLKGCCELSHNALKEMQKLRVKHLPKTVKVVVGGHDNVQAAKDLMAAWAPTRGT